MNEFIKNICTNPYFPFIIGGIIAVLIIVFIIVFIMGKKDQKKTEQTQMLKTVGEENINNSNSVNVTEQTQNEQVIQASLNTVDNTISQTNEVSIDTNNIDQNENANEELSVPQSDAIIQTSETDYIPQFNLADVPATPGFEEFEKKALNNVPMLEDIPSGNSNDDVIPFDPEPDIQPVLPENSVQNFTKIANDIESDLHDIENAMPNVAKVEAVTTDEITKIPESEVSQSTTGMPKTPIFSAVNSPRSTSDNEPIELPKLRS